MGKRGPKPSFTPSKGERIKQARKQGMTMPKIALELGISVPTLYMWMNKYNLRDETPEAPTQG